MTAASLKKMLSQVQYDSNSSQEAWYKSSSKEAWITGKAVDPPKNLCLTCALLNPFISITLSKPLMSSGSWLTLHNCEIFYLLAVNYDPATIDLIFIRVNIYPGPGEGGSLLIL